ncbi:MAG TPA: glucosamine-6-phosphate deaminase [Puia sp.]|jgi:glucosamine-6-phosphate deaminase
MMDTAAGQLKIRIYENRQQLGEAAAHAAATRIRELLEEKEYVNIIFAAAASQNEFLAALVKEVIDWRRVNGFHMDEYIGLPVGAPQLFGEWLRERIFGLVTFRNVFYLDGQAISLPGECYRYAALLEQYPVDIAFLGIGENAHLAFNDPHVADFRDKRRVKVVDLDEACKQQQVAEDCFDEVSQVPSYAFTLTIPALLEARHIYCMVPGPRKAQAVYHTVSSGITEEYPSTILRDHSDAVLFLDKDSAGKITPMVH